MEKIDEGKLTTFNLLYPKSNINLIDNDGFTLMHDAATGGHPDILSILLKAGLVVDAKSKDGRTPIMQAAKFGKLATFNMLLSKANLEIIAENGFTLLHYAAFGGHSDILGACLKAGMDVNAKAVEGETSIAEAARAGKLATFKLLSPNAKLETLDSNNRSILHYAAEGGHPYIVTALLNAGLAVDAKSADGRTALDIAKECGNQSVLALLQDAMSQTTTRSTREADSASILTTSGHSIFEREKHHAPRVTTNSPSMSSSSTSSDDEKHVTPTI